MNKYNYYIKTKENFLEDINKVAKNTYLLLSITILFSALMSIISIKMNFEKINILYYFIISLGLLFLIDRFKNSYIGLILVFIFTGFIGMFIGPILKPLLNTQSGQNLISVSLFLTGFIFFALSIYVLISKKNFDFLKGFIFIGFIAIISLVILSFFLNMYLIHALISGFIIIISSALILYETSSILNGEEENYISATISLYLQIYNIFFSILNLLNIFSSKD